MRPSSLACLVSATLLTWQPPASQTQFRARANIVQLDVSVLYGDRRPVRGLTVDDFVVVDGKEEQAIETFSEVTLPEWERLPDGWERRTPSDVVSNVAHPNGRLVAIVIDDVAAPRTPEAVAAIRSVTSLIVEQLSPGDRAALFFARARHLNERFTAERARLVAAIDRFGAEPVPGPNPTRATAIQTVGGAVRAMSAATPQSKTVFYVSPGNPVELGASFFGPDADFQTGLDDAIATALANNIRIHCIDPSLPAPASPAPSEKAARQRALQRSVLEAIADNAGGRMLAVDEFLPRRLNEVFAETRTYYLIGYRIPAGAKAGIRRSVEVRVKVPGLAVHTRDGYAPPTDPGRTKAGAPSSTLIAALSSIGGLPDPTVPLAVSVLSAGTVDSDDVSVLLLAGLLDDGRVPFSDGDPIETVMLISSLRTPPRQVVTRGVATVTRRDDGDPVRHEFISRVTLKPGSYLVRVAAERTASGAVGSVVAALDVPDVRRTPLWLSGVALISDRVTGRTAMLDVSGRRENISALPSVVPTLRRQFGRNEQLTATVHVVQGGKGPVSPVQISAQLATASTSATTFVATLGTDRFATGRAADVTIPLKLNEWAPGAYLLTIEARSSEYRMQRQVPFSVR